MTLFSLYRLYLINFFIYLIADLCQGVKKTLLLKYEPVPYKYFDLWALFFTAVCVLVCAERVFEGFICSRYI